MTPSPDAVLAPDDGLLLAAWCQRRDEAAFTRLCERHAALVASACRRLAAPDVEEATQAVFLVLAQRPRAVRDARRITGWLLGTTRKVVANQRRAAARRRHHETEAAMQTLKRSAFLAVDQLWDEVRPLLDEALLALSAPRREAMVRFYLEGKSQDEIATELGCSVDAVKTRIHEGLARLRILLRRRGVSLGASALVAGLASEASPLDAATLGRCGASAGSPAAKALAATVQAHATVALAIKALLCATGIAVAVSVAHVAFPTAHPPAPAGFQGSPPSGPSASASAITASAHPAHPPTTAADGWSDVPPPARARAGNHLVIPMTTGRLLVIGGEGMKDPDGPVSPGPLPPLEGNHPEIFAPATRTWSATGAMLVDRLSGMYTATPLRDGSVLIVGGSIDELFTGSRSCELYDPVAGAWSLAAPLLDPRWYHAAALLADGTVLVAGGGDPQGSFLAQPDDIHAEIQHSCEIYDPLRRAWHRSAPMLGVHDGLALTALKDGRVLATGGDSCELYDPRTAAWTRTAPLAHPRGRHQALLLAAGKVFVGEGYWDSHHVGICELFDPQAGTWSAVPEPALAPKDYRLTALPGGGVLLSGGFLEDAGSAPLARCSLYDPRAGKWATVQPLTHARSQHSATLLADGRVLVTAGVDGSPGKEKPLPSEILDQVRVTTDVDF